MRQDEANQSAGDYTEKLMSALNNSNENYQDVVDNNGGRDKQSYLNLVKYLSDERMSKASEKASVMGRLQAPNDMRFNDRETMSDMGNEHTYLNYLKKLFAMTDQNKIDSIQPDKKKSMLGGLMSTGGQLWAMNSMSPSSGGQNMYPSSNANQYADWLG